MAALVTENVHNESVLYTDESKLYHGMDDHFAGHETTKHTGGECVRYVGDAVIHSNNIESYFSVFKRGMRGTYQHCAEARAARVLDGVVSKRLTYETTSAR